MKARCIAKLPMPAQKMARMAISIGLQMGPYVWKCQPLCGYGRDEGKAKPFIPIEIQPSFLPRKDRSEEHTSELQSLMRNSYAVFCLKKKKQNNKLSSN